MRTVAEDPIGAQLGVDLRVHLLQVAGQVTLEQTHEQGRQASEEELHTGE